MLADESAFTAEAKDEAAAPLAVKKPHFAPKAKRVIFLFMPGGPSQVDTFDPKAQLTKDDGKPAPKLYLGQQRNLLASPWKFQRHGESGLDVSELPHTASADDLHPLHGHRRSQSSRRMPADAHRRAGFHAEPGGLGHLGLGAKSESPGFVAVGPGPITEGARQYGASFCPPRTRELCVNMDCR
jgi:hypothetical protein